MNTHRRGMCPSVAAPMPTGDGLLARIVIGGATIPFTALSTLCAAARQHGNGVIEVSARGSIQVRGLRPDTVAPFVEAVAALDISSGDGVPVLADPLAGLDPLADIDSGKLADALRERLAAVSFATKLGPKVSILVDAGSALHLDAVAADVRLRAMGTDIHLALGGDAAAAMPLGMVAEARVPEACLRLLELIAKRGPQARARDLLQDHDAMRSLRAALADLVRPAPAPMARVRAEPIGTHALSDARVALSIGLAFGHTDADALMALIEAAARAGASGIRAAPGRALLLIGLAPAKAGSLAAETERLGFITRRDDPRRNVVACAGAPICAAAEMPARELAPEISAAAGSLLDGSLTVHLSGCAKGCARPSRSALTIVGSRGGCGVVVNGTARDAALAHLAMQALPGVVARIAHEVERARRPEERAADALARIGDLAKLLEAANG
jgi:precorrin-3B synthase